MAGDTVINQLIGAAEEMTAVAMVTVAETATALETLTVTVRIRTVMPMLKGFLFGSYHNRRLFSARLYNFLVSV